MLSGKQDSLVRILIVDDEPAIRSSLSQVLAEIGFSVRSAEDGFSALAELRKERPDIFLSDLNMPGMSGFELLSVVRRRYPLIHLIAMSGWFADDQVLAKVEAEAFYQKGGGIRSLLEIIEGLSQLEQIPVSHTSSSAPLWIQRNGQDASGDSYGMISCPEYLQNIHQSVGDFLGPICEAHCIRCMNTVCYPIVEAVDWVCTSAPKAFPQENPSFGTSEP